MAKYTITHKCGHTEEVQLFGSNAEREKRIAYLESLDCEDCRRLAANAAANAAKEARCLKELSGLDKQVAWANTIRENAFKCLDMLQQFATNEQAKDMMASWRQKMGNQTDAKFWIDNRYDLPSDSNPAAAREAVRMFNIIFK